MLFPLIIASITALASQAPADSLRAVERLDVTTATVLRAPVAIVP